MRVFRPDIAAAIDGQGCERPLTGRFMRDAEPLFRIAESGDYPLVEGERLNHGTIAPVIAHATLAPVHGLIPVSASKDALPADQAYERQYRTFISLALKQNRRADFDARFGADALHALVEPLWGSFGEAYVAAFRRQHEDFLGQFDMAMETDVAYGPLIAITYAAGYAAHGAVEDYRRMRGLLHLLPFVVPIGMPEGTGRKWLVLVE